MHGRCAGDGYGCGYVWVSYDYKIIVVDDVYIADFDN